MRASFLMQASRWMVMAFVCLKWGAEEDVLGSAPRDYMVKTENPYQVLGIVCCLINFSRAESTSNSTSSVKVVC